MNITTTTETNRVWDFAGWVEIHAPEMACTPGFFRPAGGFDWYFEKGATVYVGEEDGDIVAYAVSLPNGQIKWLLARDAEKLLEFSRLLIPRIIADCGRCYGQIVNAPIRRIIAASRPTIMTDGEFLRDDSP